MRQKPWGWAALIALCVSPSVVGCAQGPNVRSELPLKRVVVYRNGVGYFERSGQVNRETVRFEMRQQMVGDFLASLAVIEKGGSSVRSASFPLEVPEFAVEPPTPAPTPAKAGAGSSEEPPHSLPRDPNPLREVVLHLDGKEHDLLIGYLSETPVWRPSYRVVVEADGSAALQAWGIVQNLSGEDWNEVSLSLVAGAPLAFQSTLGTPVIPDRPIVTDEGEVMAAVPQAVTSLDRSNAAEGVDSYGPQQGYPADAAPSEVAAEATEDMKDEEREESGARFSKSAPMKSRAARGLGLAGGASAAPPPMAPAPMPQQLSEPRRLTDLAAVALEGGITRYDMPFKVTVPNQSATMVMLTSQRVPGETVLLFAPDPAVTQSNSHPYRVARITNTTPGLLERGPIAVFERGSFLGQGLLDPLPPRATATVPFALERGVLVESEQRSDQQGARLFRIAAGNMWIERDWIQRTLYRVDSGSDKPMKLLVKHTRTPGTRLFKPPAGTEDNAGTGAALLPILVKAHSKTELTVDERRAGEEYADWFSTLADEAVRGYLADPRANRDVVQALSAAWALRTLATQANDELTQLEHEREELERLSDQTRGNLRAIEKNAQAQDLRQKLTKRLSDASNRLDTITKRVIEVRMASDEHTIRFREAVRELKFDAPLAPDLNAK
jgi:hypothetical protein